MQELFYTLMAVAIGALGGIHIPINGALGSRIHSVLVATFTFYGIAFSLIALVSLLSWDTKAFAALKTIPPWYFISGVISVIVVSGNTFLMPRIGAVNVFVLTFTAQMLVRMFISHFGLLESPVNPITAAKLIGGGLLVVGAVLIVRY